MKECVIQEQKMNIFQKTKPFLFCAFEPISKKKLPNRINITASSKQSFLKAKFG